MVSGEYSKSKYYLLMSLVVKANSLGGIIDQGDIFVVMFEKVTGGTNV